MFSLRIFFGGFFPPTATFPAMPPGDVYVLVVAACQGAESSSGRDSGGNERPAAVAPFP